MLRASVTGMVAALVMVFATGAAPGSRQPLEDSSFVYGIFADNPTCADVEKRLADLPLRSTVLLSVESKGLVLDHEGGPDLMTCALTRLRDTGHRVKALMLQDPSFLERRDESIRRAMVLAEFQKKTKLPIEGIVIDIEPYVEERWSCAALPERRQIGAEFLDLLRDLKKASGRLTVEAVIPWWYTLNDDIPELLPSSILTATDGVYFMIYGDEGGPVVNGEAQRIFRRLPVTTIASDRGRVYLALAAYESRSPADIENEIGAVRDHYAAMRGFGGIAIFHASSSYNAPLVRVVSGVVTDTSGKGVSHAVIECSGIKTETNGCGKFTVRGMATSDGTLTVSAAGYETKTMSIDLPDPGRERELKPIQLQPKKD